MFTVSFYADIHSKPVKVQFDTIEQAESFIKAKLSWEQLPIILDNNSNKVIKDFGRV